MKNPRNKTKIIKNADVPEPHPVTVEFIKKIELEEGKRYLLFIDSKNLIYESAQDLAYAMAKHNYNVSIVLTDGDPHVVAVESKDAVIPPGSVEVQPKEQT